VIKGTLTAQNPEDVKWLEAISKAIETQNRQKAKSAWRNPFGYLVEEAQQIKNIRGGYTENGQPYLEIGLNAPWYYEW